MREIIILFEVYPQLFHGIEEYVGDGSAHGDGRLDLRRHGAHRSIRLCAGKEGGEDCCQHQKCH